MARERDYMLPGTVVRHAHHKNTWGIILTVTDDKKYATVRWRGGGDRTHGTFELIRAAAPCGVCGERADSHQPQDHAFDKDTY